MAAARAYHVGLDGSRIVDVALDLSREQGLFGWSVRDLAKRLDVAPSVIYHHVGGRDLLCREVVGRVVRAIGFPSEPDEWRSWMRRALFPARAAMAAVPGTAQWLILHGPIFDTLLPVIDSGLVSLRRAGFGAFSTTAYGLLFGVAMQTIAASDERRAHSDDGPRDHAAMMADFHALAGSDDGLRTLADEFTAPFAYGDYDAVRQDHYEIVLETLMDGLERRLTA